MSRRWEFANRPKPSHYVPKYKKIYKFPPPKQPECTIDSSAVFQMCQKMWENNDMEKFNRFLITMKTIRKSIMRVGSDDTPCVDNNIINELQGYKAIDIFPHTQQILPTESTLFDSHVWYAIFRAMLPRVQFNKTLESFGILSEIYKNILETLVTNTYSQYKHEADIIFQKGIRSKQLKKNVQTEESKFLRVKSYKRSFSEYGDSKSNIISTYYNNIATIAGMHDITNLNDVIVQNIWKMFSLYFDFDPKLDAEYCINMKGKLKDEFFKHKYPKFKLDSCTEQMYNDWLSMYPNIQKYNAVIAYPEPENYMERDNCYIKAMREAIYYGKFAKFTDQPTVYKKLGLIPISTDDEVFAALTKLTEVNFEVQKYTFNMYLNDDIVRILFMYCRPEMFINTYMKLLQYLSVDDITINKYIDLLNVKKKSIDGVEQMYSEYTIAALYVFGFIDSMDYIVKKFNKVSIPEVISTIYKNKNLFELERWETVSKELSYYANKYYKELTGKFKWRMLDIAEEIDSKKKPAPRNNKVEEKEESNKYSILANE